MERRFQARLDDLLDDADVPLSLLRGALPRLGEFLEPFICCLIAPQRANAKDYVEGLLSDLQSKDAESIAYLHDRERQGIQKFIGQADWDHRPLVSELARQVGQELGRPDGVIVFDPSAFVKQGKKSVGVQRQWCGRLGKVENCQVGVYLGYVSHEGHALVDFRLYLPKGWAGARERRQEAGVPKDVRFATRHELALHMLDERGSRLPHRWVAGDDEMGRSTRFRQQLRQRGERYLLAVPGNTLVRDLVPPDPPYSGQGRRPRVPFVRADAWRAALPEGAWETVEVRDGEKGPLLTQFAWTLVQAKGEGKVSDVAESLLVFREQQGDGSWKHDYLLSNEVASSPPVEMAWLYKAEHRIEECIKQAKSEAGLADYQVRTWEGWHHHQCLSLLAAWFLVEEARRGKNPDARADGAPGPGDDSRPAEPGAGGPPPGPNLPHHEPSIEAQRGTRRHAAAGATGHPPRPAARPQAHRGSAGRRPPARGGPVGPGPARGRQDRGGAAAEPGGVVGRLRPLRRLALSRPPLAACPVARQGLPGGPPRLNRGRRRARRRPTRRVDSPCGPRRDRDSNPELPRFAWPVCWRRWFGTRSSRLAVQDEVASGQADSPQHDQDVQHRRDLAGAEERTVALRARGSRVATAHDQQEREQQPAVASHEVPHHDCAPRSRLTGDLVPKVAKGQ
jgi:SRSO17 transposase